MYLPDRVGVFARVSSAPEDWLSALLPEIIDTHSTIIQPHCQEVGVGGVDVQREDTTGGGVDEPGGRGRGVREVRQKVERGRERERREKERERRRERNGRADSEEKEMGDRKERERREEGGKERERGGSK